MEECHELHQQQLCHFRGCTFIQPGAPSTAFKSQLRCGKAVIKPNTCPAIALLQRKARTVDAATPPTHPSTGQTRAHDPATVSFSLKTALNRHGGSRSVNAVAVTPTHNARRHTYVACCGRFHNKHLMMPRLNGESPAG